eukprot:744219-Prorocentrum_minimum.AAC.7
MLYVQNVEGLQDLSHCTGYPRGGGCAPGGVGEVDLLALHPRGDEGGAHAEGAGARQGLHGDGTALPRPRAMQEHTCQARAGARLLI